MNIHTEHMYKWRDTQRKWHIGCRQHGSIEANCYAENERQVDCVTCEFNQGSET